MSKFTPGKWEAKGFSYDEPYIAVKSGEKVICFIGCVGDLREKEANAVLMAAAPEMFEMLKAFATMKFNASTEDGKLRKKAYDIVNQVTRVHSAFYPVEGVYDE